MNNMTNGMGNTVNVPETITREYVETVFKNELALIHNDFMKEIAVKTLMAAPKEFWSAPASSSGKYHAEDERAAGGLVLHEKKVVKYAHYFAQEPDCWDEMKANNYIAYDGLIVAALLHDCVKSGNPWGAQTVSNHPDLASELVIKVNGATLYTRAIARTIKTHMGWKWGDTVWGDETNRAKTLCQKLLCRADMTGSRVFISTDVSNMDIR